MTLSSRISSLTGPDRAVEAEARKAIERDAFDHGYFIAVSTMLHQHGCEVTAEDALNDAGLNRRRAKQLELDEFDMKVLRPVFRMMEARKADKRRAMMARGL